MNIQKSGTEFREQQLDEIIAEYLRRRGAGDAHVEAELLAAHGEFATELGEFFGNEAGIARVMEPLAKPWGKSDPLAPTTDAALRQDGIPSTDIPLRNRPALDGRRYRLEHFHDRGGMGEIWVGRDQRIGREVAVKVLRRERQNQQDRFQMEAEITGQLEHPSIVRVYDFDIGLDGQPFYVMQFVRGRRLKDAIAEFHSGKLRPEQKRLPTDPEQKDTELAFHGLLEVMVDLCQTVAYAHSRGVLHRDLKPENVMLGAFGETLVLDWGLAKVKDRAEDPGAADCVRASGSGSSATQAGAVLGSPPYMSPEAAAGQVHNVDEASDVFLLGATLYEVLTSLPPRQGSSPYEIVDLARTTDPPAPRVINKSVPRPLEAICLKAMARYKADRYSSALEMATDLRRFLAGEPVSAYPENLPERLARWARRHRRAIGYAAVAMVMLALTSFGVAKWREAERLQAYDRGTAEVAEFRQLAGEVHFLATGTDPVSEQAPYYQIGAGQRIAKQALALADQWGNDLELLSLFPDREQETREKDQIKHEVYDLVLLQVQSRLHEAATQETATESLALLDRARSLAEPTSSYFRLRAECLRELGQVEAADDAQRKAIDPRIPRIALDHFLQGELHRRQTLNLRWELSEDEQQVTQRQLLEQAVAAFELAIRENPSHYWAHLQIGRCLMALDRYPEAIRTFSGCVALRPNQPWAYTSRSLAYAMSGNRQKGLDDLDQWIEDAPAFQPALNLSRGFLQLLGGDDDRALADFDRILEAAEDHRLSGAAYYRSQIRERRADSAGALRDLDWIIDRDPAFARAYKDRARLLIALGRQSAAMNDLNAYLSLATADFDEQSWIACYGRGRLLLDIQVTVPLSAPELREWLESQAMRQFQQAVDLGGSVAGLFQELGRLHFLAGDPQAALDVYEKGLTKCPQSASLHLARGWLFAESNETAAAQEFDATLRLDPKNYEALGALGYVHARTRANDAAERCAMEATLLGSQKYAALFNIAGIHGELGESDPDNKDKHHRDAIILLRRAIALWKEAGSPEAQNILELIQREQDRAFRTLRFSPEFKQLTQ